MNEAAPAGSAPRISASGASSVGVSDADPAPAVLALIAAELKVEWRNPGSFVSAALFAVLVLLTQAMSFPTDLSTRPEISFAAFFISVFFASLLAEHSRISRDNKSGVPCLLALSRVPAHLLFAGKTAAMFALMSLIEACLIPVLIVFYNLPVSQVPPAFVLLCLLANGALAGLMTLFGTASSVWKGSGNALALPILILPLALPILVTAAVGSGRMMADMPYMPYLKLILAADISVACVGCFAFGKLLGRA